MPMYAPGRSRSIHRTCVVSGASAGNVQWPVESRRSTSLPGTHTVTHLLVVPSAKVLVSTALRQLECGTISTDPGSRSCSPSGSDPVAGPFLRRERTAHGRAAPTKRCSCRHRGGIRPFPKRNHGGRAPPSSASPDRCPAPPVRSDTALGEHLIAIPHRAARGVVTAM